jgi:Zn-dependent peptidase ImmA (M78 family)
VARRLSRPRQLGLDLLVEVGARTPEQIDPIETAKELGIEIAFGHLTGATARIYRVGSKARIRVSDQIVTEGRRRMSIMHEIAHYVLGHELPREGDLEGWFQTSCSRRSKGDERDADVLAVEHLTPEPMVRPYCAATPVDFTATEPIEHLFLTSRVMAAVRFVELSPEACAVVYSDKGSVRWMKPSKTFPTFLGRGTVLSNSSIAGEYFDTGAICELPQSRRVSTWLGSNPKLPAEAMIVEHASVIPGSGWGGVLSLLWLPRAEATA